MPSFKLQESDIMNRYDKIYDSNLVELLDFINSQSNMNIVSVFQDNMGYYVAVVEKKV